jgi:hypothetical protein
LVCGGGTSKSADEFRKVPEEFVARFPAAGKLGYFFFPEVVTDQAASLIKWEICATVAAKTPVPSGLTLRQVDALPALFVLCDDESTRCAAPAIDEIAGRLADPASRQEFSAAARRGFVIDRPDGDGKHDASVREVVRTDMPLVRATATAALDPTLMAGLRDARLERAPVSAARETTPPAVVGKTNRRGGIALPLSAQLRDALKPLMP